MKTLCPVLLLFALVGCSTGGDVKSDSGPANGTAAIVETRTTAEIQGAFDHNKGALVSIYNRARRLNKDLAAGKIVFDFTIESDGSLSSVTIVSSTFHDADFEGKLAERIGQIGFSARDVPPFTCRNYPIEFRPM